VTSPTTFDSRMDFRVHSADKAEFRKKCKAMGKDPQELQREMVKAVIENRLKIKVTPEQLNNQQEIYDVT
jgi:hypothetical protein